MKLRKTRLPIEELAAWVYEAAVPAEKKARIEELRLRSQHGPVLQGAWATNEGLVFGAYFYTLPGNVLTLGGIRALAPPRFCVGPFLQVLEQCSAIRPDQLQAIIPDDIPREIRPILSSHFEQITEVFHIFRELPPTELMSPSALTAQPAGGPPRTAEIVDAAESGSSVAVRWQPARNFSRQFVAERIADTFLDTQDCPELNGLRSSEQILDGFLDGRPLREVNDWYLLELGGEHIGCALFTHHEESRLLELTYMGLRPSARKRGLGRNLVELALRRGRSYHCIGVAAAVDRRNLPALKVYESMGFGCHTKYQVWLDMACNAVVRNSA